jgi:hypothetical protein
MKMFNKQKIDVEHEIGEILGLNREYISMHRNEISKIEAQILDVKNEIKDLETKIDLIFRLIKGRNL